jgi:hypothetical protein
VVTSWVTLGALLGALAAGESADQISRKRTVLTAGAMFTLGALVQETGLIGMGISVVVVGVAFRFIVKPALGAAAATGPSTAGIVTLFALVCFIICFAFSMGPVTWTVISEVFPGRIRGRAVGIATAVNWVRLSWSANPSGRCRGDRQFIDLLAVRIVLLRRLSVDLLSCAGNQETITGTDPAALEGGALMLIAGDIGGTTARLALASPDAGPRIGAWYRPRRGVPDLERTGLHRLRVGRRARGFRARG